MSHSCFLCDFNSSNTCYLRNNNNNNDNDNNNSNNSEYLAYLILKVYLK